MKTSPQSASTDEADGPSARLQVWVEGLMFATVYFWVDREWWAGALVYYLFLSIGG